MASFPVYSIMKLKLYVTLCKHIVKTRKIRSLYSQIIGNILRNRTRTLGKIRTAISFRINHVLGLDFTILWSTLKKKSLTTCWFVHLHTNQPSSVKQHLPSEPQQHGDYVGLIRPKIKLYLQPNSIHGTNKHKNTNQHNNQERRQHFSHFFFFTS